MNSGGLVFASSFKKLPYSTPGPSATGAVSPYVFSNHSMSFASGEVRSSPVSKGHSIRANVGVELKGVSWS
jgi:hypothetical protein|eukprot:29471-Pelagococcus_subviridis.AAC.6